MHNTFQSKNVSLVAISVDAKEDSEKLAKDLNISYPLLSDEQLKVATDYGVAMKGQDIAVPAAFIILPDRRIFWKHVGESVTDRPYPEELTMQVDKAVEASNAITK